MLWWILLVPPNPLTADSQFGHMKLTSKSHQNVVMVCTAARGGIRSVVEGYLADGLLARWNVVVLNSHVEGGIAVRLLTGMRALLHLILLLLKRQVGLVHCHSICDDACRVCLDRVHIRSAQRNSSANYSVRGWVLNLPTGKALYSKTSATLTVFDR